MRITPHLSVVASGQAGYGLTSPWDCNVYLIESNGQAALIDAGCGLEFDRIMARVTQVNPDVAIDHVFVTHSHADHAAGANRWREEFDTTVVAPSCSAASMRAGDETTSGLAASRASGGYPSDFTYPPLVVDHEVVDGDRFEIGALVITAIATPGHSTDHTCYLVEGMDHGPALFSGDVLLSDGRVVLLTTPDCRLDQYPATLVRLAAFKPASLLPGHGAFSLTEGQVAIAAARSYFDRMVPPPSLGQGPLQGVHR